MTAPHEPLSGDSHARLLEPLEVFARSLGYTVSLESIEGGGLVWAGDADRRQC